MRLTPVHALPVVLVAAALAGCGGDGDGSSGGSTPPPATTQQQSEGAKTTPATGPDGAEVFASAGCGSCHTLAAANADGNIGPNLDDLKLTAGVVRSQVENGGGGMPAFDGDLSPEEIDAVSTFVAENAGR